MEELVGHCDMCKKPVYCENGFLNGVHQNGKLYCNSCEHKLNEKRD